MRRGQEIRRPNEYDEEAESEYHYQQEANHLGNLPSALGNTTFIKKKDYSNYMNDETMTSTVEQQDSPRSEALDGTDA